MYLGTERRRHTRFPFKVDIEFESNEKIILATQSRNISMGGIYIISKECFSVGTKGFLTVTFSFDHEVVKITPEGEVVSVMSAIEPEKYFGIGIQFLHMDTQSEIYLSNVIESLGL